VAVRAEINIGERAKHQIARHTRRMARGSASGRDAPLHGWTVVIPK
jgi:hypothetical protein